MLTDENLDISPVKNENTVTGPCRGLVTFEVFHL